jgi:hypothetical protein
MDPFKTTRARRVNNIPRRRDETNNKRDNIETKNVGEIFFVNY